METECETERCTCTPQLTATEPPSSRSPDLRYHHPHGSASSILDMTLAHRGSLTVFAAMLLFG